jgi:hypothetical protein
MNQFQAIQVVEFKLGKTVETWETEQDLRTGTKGRELLGKTQINWDDSETGEWVPSYQIARFDKNTHILDRTAQKPTKATKVEEVAE